MTIITFIKSHVIRGFGRGSRELGCPTANVADINHLNINTGIYCGLAQITIRNSNEIQEDPNRKETFEIVSDRLPMTSHVIGWVGSFGYNPTYDNKDKSLEVHLFNDFGYDFYGAEIRVLICKRLRDEEKYNSLDELKDAIANDIRNAKSEIVNFQHLSNDKKYFIPENSTF